MPIYEYQCDACGERLEVMQKISDRPLKQCPACKQNRLRKLVSAAAFRLKGSGWYETDFKKDGKKNVVSGGDDSGAFKEKGKAPAKTGEKEKAEPKPATAEKDKGAAKPGKPASKASGTTAGD